MPQIALPSEPTFPRNTGMCPGDRDCPPASDTASPEWCLIEVQGELDAAGADLTRADTFIDIGSLTFDAQNTPWLIIGRHKLRGKRVALEKPYAVLRRPKQSRDLKRARLDAEDGSDVEDGSGAEELVCLIRSKYIFSERPVLVLSSHNVGLTGLAKRKN
ncbi:Chromosome transmission fidelity protein 8 [Entophlyctis luteolus]|nr:Chromosome transmission fidelity protein 8 [Entophlyctis luteolus]KAJ3381895.1 Chromosome transmission fidelity protein 8 [Entophlyctis sp. JEL0112]